MRRKRTLLAQVQMAMPSCTGKWAIKEVTWHRRGKKCVIWFQEGSQDSELVILATYYRKLRTLFKRFSYSFVCSYIPMCFLKPTKYCYFLICSLYLYNSA